MIQQLDADEIIGGIAGLNEWTPTDDSRAIVQSFVFRDFVEALVS